MATIAETETVTVGRVTYTVTRTDSDQIPYELHGPRGAHYGLMRNAHNPHALFVINVRRFGVVKTMPWFSDRLGVLVPLN
jgi:hypothetical protein